MDFKVRSATMQDRGQLLQLYNSFTEQHVGSVLRNLKSFTRKLRKKENLNYVALDSQNRIVGYVHASLNKRNNIGEFGEIIVDPRHDWEKIALLLAETVNSIFVQKKASAISAGSLRNPIFERIFPKLGFLESESKGVFMYAVLDAPKLLDELSPMFANRLKRVENWNGLAQLECGGHSLFLQRTKDNIQRIVWTNQRVDFKIKLDASTLTKLLFGVADAIECRRNNQLVLETTLDASTTDRLLKAMFPQVHFLIMDYW